MYEDEVRIEGASGHQLRAWRLMSNLNTVQVAVALGLSVGSQTNVADWEKERLKVPPKHYERLEDLYYIDAAVVEVIEALKATYKAGMTIPELVPIYDKMMKEKGIVPSDYSAKIVKMWGQIFLDEQLDDLTRLVLAQLEDGPKTVQQIALATKISKEQTRLVLSSFNYNNRRQLIQYDYKTKLWRLTNGD